MFSKLHFFVKAKSLPKKAAPLVISTNSVHNISPVEQQNEKNLSFSTIERVSIHPDSEEAHSIKELEDTIERMSAEHLDSENISKRKIESLEKENCVIREELADLQKNHLEENVNRISTLSITGTNSVQIVGDVVRKEGEKLQPDQHESKLDIAANNMGQDFRPVFSESHIDRKKKTKVMAENKKLKKILKQKNDDIQSLKNKVSEHSKMYKLAQKKLETCQKQKDELGVKLTEMNKNSREFSLRAQLRDNCKFLESVESENKALVEQVRELKDQLEKKEMDQTATILQLSKVEEENRNIQRNLQDHFSNLEVQKDLENEKRHSKKLRKENHQLTEDLVFTQCAKDKALEEIDVLRRELQQSRDTAQHFRDEADKFYNDAGLWKQKCEKLDMKLKRSQQEEAGSRYRDPGQERSPKSRKQRPRSSPDSESTGISTRLLSNAESGEGTNRVRRLGSNRKRGGRRRSRTSDYRDE